MEFAGGDSDFRAETKLAAIGELGRRVPHHDRAVDAVEEALGGGGVVFALALVLPGLVYLRGACAVYLAMTEASVAAAENRAWTSTSR